MQKIKGKAIIFANGNRERKNLATKNSQIYEKKGKVAQICRVGTFDDHETYNCHGECGYFFAS